MTQRVGYFALGGYVTNAAWDSPLSLASPFDRSRHDRQDLHFGVGSAMLVQLSDAVGAMPAGSTLEETLRYLMNWLVEKESINGSWFTIDAYSDERTFWRDLFDRTVGTNLGTSTGSSDFGPFLWQRLGASGLDVDVDGAEAEFTGTGSSNDAEFVGYPTIGEGELYFEVFVPVEDTTGWRVALQPWRDDVTDADAWVELAYSGGWFLTAGIADLFETSQTPTEGWYSVRFDLSAPGGTSQVKIWPRGTTEPGWENSGTLPSGATGHRWLILGGAGKFAWSEDAVTWTETADGSDNFEDVAYGPAFGVPTWMAVGSFLGIKYSRDAETWTNETTDHHVSPTTLPTFWRCATDGAGTWVAFNLSSAVPWRAIGDPATSFWNPQSALSSGARVVRWGNGLFVAGSANNGALATSPDGGTWTNRTAFDTSTDWMQDAVYGNEWVAIGGGGGDATETRTAISSDGLTWSLNSIAELYDYFVNAIAFGNDVYACVANLYDDNSAIVATSSDGVSWTINDLGIFNTLTDIAFIDGVWVLVGDSGLVMETDDPAGTWTSQTSGFSSTQVSAAIGRHAISSRGAPVLHVSNSSDTSHRTLLLDHIKAQKADADPARLYRVFTLDAEVS